MSRLTPLLLVVVLGVVATLAEKTLEERFHPMIAERVHQSFMKNIQTSGYDSHAQVARSRRAESTCADCLSAGKTWFGVCSPTPIDFLGCAWKTGVRACNEPCLAGFFTEGSFDNACVDAAGDSATCTTAMKKFENTRVAVSMPKGEDLLYSSFDTASILAPLELTMTGIAIGSKVANIGDGPPRAYTQLFFGFIAGSSYNTQTGQFAIGQIHVNYAVLGDLARFDSSAHPAGMTLPPSNDIVLTDVENWYWVSNTVTGQNTSSEYHTVKFCTDNAELTVAKICLIASIGGKNTVKFTIAGREIDSSTEMKFALTLENVQYSGQLDSAGIRLFLLSQSASLDAIVQAEDGEAELISGPFYFKYEKTIATGTSTIPALGSNEKTVVDSQGSLAASTCGAVSWYTNPVKSYMQSHNMDEVSCQLFSFMSGDASLKYFNWDPTQGVDPKAFKSSAAAAAPALLLTVAALVIHFFA